LGCGEQDFSRNDREGREEGWPKKAQQDAKGQLEGVPRSSRRAVLRAAHDDDWNTRRTVRKSKAARSAALQIMTDSRITFRAF